jgi:glycosyltransferase involved in cell wall biosynthesis
VRIAQVVSSYHPQIGGVETHVRRLAQGCAAAGDRVTVLTHQFRGSPAEEFVDGVRVLRFPLTAASPRYPLSLSLFRYVKLHSADFDVIHAHNYHTLAGHAAIRSRLPFVFTPHYHGTGHTRLAALLHRAYRPAGSRLLRSASAVVCVSEAERDLVITDFPGICAKTVTIPNGSDLKDTPGMDRAGPGPPLVLAVGRLERYKNVDLVIDAFRALRSPATLVVVGDGPDRGRLEQHVRNTRPGLPVVFTGRVSDTTLSRLFAQASVVTSASDHEAFGLTLTEGLASGARVVASAIPAHAALGQMVGADGPVALVDPRDSEKFAGVIETSLLAGRIRPETLKLPSWPQIVENTRELYSQVRLQGYPADQRGP